MQRFLSLLLRTEAAMAVTAYSVTVGLLVADVISREVFSQAIWGAQKLAVFGAIIAGILGLTIAVAENAHLQASFASKMLPFRWAGRLGDLVSACLFAIMGYYAMIFVGETIHFDDRAEVINIPLWWVQIVFPYSFFAAALRHLAFAFYPALKPDSSTEH